MELPALTWYATVYSLHICQQKEEMSTQAFDLIWIIVDRLTKSTHFIPVKTNYWPYDYATLYLAHIVRLHGIPRTIMSDRGSQFTASFWEHLHQALGTKLIRSSAYHPQTTGQTERVNQILEDMLRACVIYSKGSWEKWLPLAEFSYNNNYQESIKMAPFRPCMVGNVELPWIGLIPEK